MNSLLKLDGDRIHEAVHAPNGSNLQPYRFLFVDDAERPLRVWDHIDGDLVERARPDDGVFECVCLELFWVVIPHPAFVRMLRLSRDRAGREVDRPPPYRLPGKLRLPQVGESARQPVPVLAVIVLSVGVVVFVGECKANGVGCGVLGHGIGSP